MLKHSPINCSVLSFIDYSGGVNSPIDNSPVICRSRVPKRHRIMDDEDDNSLTELVDFDGEFEGTPDIGSSRLLEERHNELISEDSIDLSDLARSIMDDCLDPHVSDEELKLIMNSTVNTKKYERVKGESKIVF